MIDSYHKNPSLFSAAMLGNVVQVHYLLMGGADVNQLVDGWSALHIASYHDHHDIVQSLIEYGADVNQLVDGWSALHIASYHGYYNTVRTLINSRADVSQLVDGWSSLRIAVYYDHSNTVAELLRVISFIEEVDNNGFTLLHIASFHGHYDTVQTLINSGADINIESACGLTSLEIAIYRQDHAMVNLLLQNRAIIDRGNDMFHPLYMAILCDNMIAFESLLAYGANPNGHIYMNFTALYMATWLGREQAISSLLTHEALADQGLADGTLLSLAISLNSPRIVEILIQEGNADVNGRTMGRYTPLDLAVMLFVDRAITSNEIISNEIINILLHHGARFTCYTAALNPTHTDLCMLTDASQNESQATTDNAAVSATAADSLFSVTGIMVGERSNGSCDARAHHQQTSHDLRGLELTDEEGAVVPSLTLNIFSHGFNAQDYFHSM